MRRERIQFPLRALFIFTLAAGLLAAVTRWLIGLNDSAALLASISIGFFVGFATVAIIQNVHTTRLLIALLLGLAASGLWFSGRFIGYGGGVFIGAIVALHGLNILNAIFRFCGLTVSITQNPTRSDPND